MHVAGQLSGGGCEDVVLRVSVLGPVMAWNGDQELPVGQPRQQAVLGILAMRANRIISRSELVDAVWGQDPPTSAEGGVYTYVAGLRRIFEPWRSLRGPGRILVSSGAGYRLHRSGRQAEALHVYEEGRGVLAEELGIDPGADLSRIHQQVLTMDPALDVTSRGQAAVSMPVHVPAHLPADAPGFSGRRDELRALHGMLD